MTSGFGLAFFCSAAMIFDCSFAVSRAFSTSLISASEDLIFFFA